MQTRTSAVVNRWWPVTILPPSQVQKQMKESQDARERTLTLRFKIKMSLKSMQCGSFRSTEQHPQQQWTTHAYNCFFRATRWLHAVVLRKQRPFIFRFVHWRFLGNGGLLVKRLRRARWPDVVRYCQKRTGRRTCCGHCSWMVYDRKRDTARRSLSSRREPWENKRRSTLKLFFFCQRAAKKIK